MKKYAAGALALVFSALSASSPPQASGDTLAVSSPLSLPAALTGEALGQLVGATIQRLQNAGTTLIGEAAIQANGLAGVLNDQMNHLNQILGDNIKVPLATLGGDIQNAATKLNNAVARVDDLLNRQRSCLFINETLFISGLKSVASNLKTGVPFVSEGAPWVSHYTFDRMSVPMVVPREGGRFTVSGFSLWDDEPPALTLRSEDRKTVLAKLDAERAGSDDAVSAFLSPDIIKANTGQCLDLQVDATHVKRFLFLRFGTETSELHVPLCISPDYETSFTLAGNLYAEVVKETSLPRPAARTFYFANDSCEDRKNVEHTNVWDELRGDDHITNFDAWPGDLMRHQSSIGLAKTDRNSIRAAGWIDTAACVNAFVGRKRLSSAVYHMVVQPYVVGTRPVKDEGSATSAKTPVSMPETKICTDIPKSDATPNTNWWFEIKQLTTGPNGEKQKTLFQSDRLVTTQNPGAMTTARKEGYIFDASVNPQPVNGKGQICTVIKVPDQCRY